VEPVEKEIESVAADTSELDGAAEVAENQANEEGEDDATTEQENNEKEEDDESSSTSGLVQCRLPAKFRKLVWIKRGNYVVVEGYSNFRANNHVQFEIVHVLNGVQIKSFKKRGEWYVSLCVTPWELVLFVFLSIFIR